VVQRTRELLSLQQLLKATVSLDRVVTHMPEAPNETIAFNFGVGDDIDNLITHFKFYVYTFRCFGAVTPSNLGIFIGLASGSYNSATL